MNKQQNKSAAKYLYDISKIVFTFAVIGNLLARENFSFWILLCGITGVIFSFVWAYQLDGKEEIGHE